MAQDIFLGRTKRDWSCGSLLLPAKQQKALLAKADDIRYDLRRTGAKMSMATLALAAFTTFSARLFSATAVRALCLYSMSIPWTVISLRWAFFMLGAYSMSPEAESSPLRRERLVRATSGLKLSRGTFSSVKRALIPGYGAARKLALPSMTPRPVPKIAVSRWNEEG